MISKIVSYVIDIIEINYQQKKIFNFLKKYKIKIIIECTI